MRKRFMQPRTVRREGIENLGRLRGGKLVPIAAIPFMQSEGGTVRQSIYKELDPIPARVKNQITSEVVTVFAPLQAIHALAFPDEEFAISADAYRKKLMSGQPVFGMEEEHEISKQMRIMPRSIGGVKKVDKIVRLAHNVAVNHLRLRKYHKADLLDKDDTGITPALFGSTILQRLNAVLDPSDRVNGAVEMIIPEQTMPVTGIARNSGGRLINNVTARETGGTTVYPKGISQDWFNLREDPDNPGHPLITANMPATTQSISAHDLYRAERWDALARDMDGMVKDYPQYGEEMLVRFAYGLDVDMQGQPLVVYERSTDLNQSIASAMDGPSLDQVSTTHQNGYDFVVPVPASEFGGVLITFITVKPDETIGSQPHPIFSQPWGGRNYITEQDEIKPVPVTVRDLHSDCAVGQEETVSMHMGNNHLLKHYVSYGFTRNTDLNEVINKSRTWQLQIPLSLTPSSVIYPEYVDHYPFADHGTEADPKDVCTYIVTSGATIATPVIMGPTPIEQLELDADIFEDEA